MAVLSTSLCLNLSQRRTTLIEIDGDSPWKLAAVIGFFVMGALAIIEVSTLLYLLSDSLRPVTGKARHISKF